MIDEVVRSFTRTLDFLERLLADVPDSQWTQQPGGVVNHPAWVIGHLAHSCQAIGGELGIEPWLPPDWAHRFGTGSVPVDDPGEYPSAADVRDALAEGQRRVVVQLEELGEAALREPLPDVRYREEFPTLGHAVVHVLTSHTAVHVGQISVWRRAAGFAPLRSPFI